MRQQAVLALGRLREPESAPLLIPLLHDDDPRLRFAAVRALGQIRNADAVPHLLPLLGDARKELRFAAVEALGQIRAPAAVRPLVEALRDPDRNLRRAAAEGLGEIGDPQAVPPLLLALEDEHWSVRCAAAVGPRPARQPEGDRRPARPPRRRRRDRAPCGGVGARRGRRLARGRPARRRARRSRPAGGRARGPAAARPRRAAGDRARLRLGRASTRRCGGSWSTSRAGSRTAGLAAAAAGRALPTPRADVRAEAAAGPRRRRLPGGAARPALDLKSEDPSPEVRQAAASALRKLAAPVKFPSIDHDAELSEEEFRLLRDFIHEQLRALLRRRRSARACAARLAPRLALLGLVSFEDYYHYLRFAPERAEEQQRMVSHLTNNETYFFREQPQLNVFANHVLRAVKDRKTRSGERHAARPLGRLLDGRGAAHRSP